MEIDHKARGSPEYSSTTELLRQHLCYFGHADVERDMIVQQTGMNGKVYVGGHMVGCMVAHDQDAAAVQLANDMIRFCFHSTHSRSEEHTSELQSLMRISYAVFCLKKKK